MRHWKKELLEMSSNPPREPIAIGVGLDTARYGHHATFLREDRQPAAEPLEFLECRDGYQQLEDLLRKLVQRYEKVHFHIRVDAASQYALNLLAFLDRLPWPKTISVGQPRQNKLYREVHFPKRKADATESHACARFAIVERPHASATVGPELLVLQEVVSRLEFQVKQSTRLVNRLHNLLSRVFPELATLQNDLQARWVLRLLEKYPTAERIAKARPASVAAIPCLRATKASQVHQAAAQSVAVERGPVIEEVVRESIRALQVSLDAEKRLGKLLIQAFRELPDEKAKQIATIKGIGERTAAVLVAKIFTIDRFPTASHLTSYFGVFPEERTSGVDRDGNPLPSRSKRMSRQGNDLVRKYLWMSAWSAITFNPAVAALYVRLRQRGRRGDVALGHCMKKLLHQVFGVWTSGKPYDADRASETTGSTPGSKELVAEKIEAEGRKTGNAPLRKTVTSTSTDIVADKQPIVKRTGPSTDADGSIDFAYVRSQITMERVLRHLGYFDRLRGSGSQRRGPCPVHGAKRARGRSFSVHLGKDVFQCFHPPCGAAGNVLDLWCAIHRLTPYEGARHLAITFDLPLTRKTEKQEPVTEPVSSLP
jgi:transposase